MSAPFRFIHAADLHLDSPFKGLSKAPEVVKADLTASTFTALKKLTDTAIAENVDFIVISGDMFDEADSSLKAQLALVKEWEKLGTHGIGVFAIHGNHDHLGGKRAAMKLPSNVRLFGSEEMGCAAACRRTGEPVAYIYGMSYGKRSETRNLAAAYHPISRDDVYHIALLHANVGGDPAHDSYAPCTLEELKGSGFQYWALGHIHKRELLHEYPHIVYPGNTQGRNPKETGAKGCYIVDVSDTGFTELRFTALDAIRWEEETVSIDGIATEQELLRTLDQIVAARLEAESGTSVMLRLRLTGRGELHHKVSQPHSTAALLEELQQEYEPLGGAPWIHVYDLAADTGVGLDLSALMEEESFTGELLRLSYQLERDEEEWSRFAQAALRDAREHAKLGRIGRKKWDELPVSWLNEARELTLGLMTRHD